MTHGSYSRLLIGKPVMKYFNPSMLLVALLFFPVNNVIGQFNKGGRTAFQFVKIGIGARQTATGEASIAGVRDINSAFWNPAGISGVANAEASFTYTRWFSDLHIVAGAAGYHWDRVGVFALSYASLDYGKIPEALVSVPSGSSDTRTGATFGGGNLLVGLSFSRAFTNLLSIGGTVKFLQEQLFTYTVRVTAFDVGTHYETGFNGIRIAMAAQNFASSVKWLAESDREEGYDIPLIFRIGTSVSLLGTHQAFFSVGDQHRLDLMVDAVHTNDYAERFHVGGEYTFNEMFSLRGGYKFNYAEGNLSLGFGVKQTLAGFQWRLDYTYVNFTYLDSPHRLTVILGF
jgi:hypothetical protein